LYALGGRTSFSGLMKQKWPVPLFCLHVWQYIMLQSRFIPLSSTPQVLQNLLRSQNISCTISSVCGSRNMFGSWNVYYTLHKVFWQLWNTWRTRNAIATRLLTAVVGITRARFITCITHKPLRHRARYIHDHMIVLFDINVEQINSFWGVDLHFQNYVFTLQALINGYLILPKMFLEFD